MSERYAVVTGASGGIGRATAIRLASKGFYVFGTVRRTDDGERLEQAGHGRVTALRMELTRPETIAASVASVEEATGGAAGHGLDVLVDNAGVGVFQPLEYVPLQAFRRQLEINVTAQLEVTQRFLPLVRRASGRIVMLGSVADRFTLPFAGPTAASKHALLALAEAFRQELAPWSIPVIVIEPGTIRSDAVGKLEHEVATIGEALGPRGEELYGRTYRDMMARALGRTREGSPPEAVAEVIERAVLACRPRARYRGRHAFILTTLAKLPPWLLDGVRRRLFGLPRPGSASAGR